MPKEYKLNIISDNSKNVKIIYLDERDENTISRKYEDLIENFKRFVQESGIRNSVIEMKLTDAESI